MLNLMGVLNNTTSARHTNVSCTCNCKPSTSFQSMELTQLEFVQILVIVVVMMVMVVVITCLLNHYRLSARSLLSRHAHSRRRHLPLASEGGLWSSDGLGTASGSSEQHQVYTPRAADRSVPPSYHQRDLPHPSSNPQSHPQSQSHPQTHPQSHPQAQRFQQTYAPSRFQPTYPYLPQSLIDLPPTISLSDGEEPPPYQGPCTLQLRDPEQQMELNRESVRAPPNRTVFDSHLLDPTTPCLQARLQAPPPSVHAGISVLEAQEALARQQKQGTQVEGAPPAYSEVIGHYYHPTSLTPNLGHSHNHQTLPPQQAPAPSLIHGVLRPPPPGSVDNRNARNTKEKSHKPQQV